METLLHTCAKVREPIQLLFGVVSGVSLGILVLGGGPGAPRGRGSFSGFSTHWFEWRIFRTEIYSSSA